MPRKLIYHYQAAYQFGPFRSPSAAAYESTESNASASAFAITGLWIYYVEDHWGGRRRYLTGISGLAAVTKRFLFLNLTF